jgi:presenilin-like A22 family membrane protease
MRLQPELAQQLPTYWGPQPFVSGPVYFGALIICLFIFALLTIEDKNKWWILAGTIVFILLSWGKHLDLNNW